MRANPLPWAHRWIEAQWPPGHLRLDDGDGLHSTHRHPMRRDEESAEIFRRAAWSEAGRPGADPAAPQIKRPVDAAPAVRDGHLLAVCASYVAARGRELGGRAGMGVAWVSRERERPTPRCLALRRRFDRRGRIRKAAHAGRPGHQVIDEDSRCLLYTSRCV